MEVNKEPQSPSILAVHLLNNYSGSPRIFSLALKALKGKGIKVDLITSRGPGLLDGITDRLYRLPYRWSSNKYVRLLRFTISQIYIFYFVLRYANSTTLVYINTLLPAAATLAAHVKKANVIYHLHETHVSPSILDKILKKVLAHGAHQSIFVSRYLQKTYPTLDSSLSRVIYNSSPPPGNKQVLQKLYRRPTDTFEVLMISSLKREKGIHIFVELAKYLPQYQFTLIIGTDLDTLAKSTDLQNLGDNIIVLTAQKDLIPFYRKASVLLNLSFPDILPESFGMTVLEAMQWGIPCIVPPVGGPTELIEDGKHGFRVSAYNTELLMQRIIQLDQDKSLYDKMSYECLNKARFFDENSFNQNICNYIISNQ